MRIDIEWLGEMVGRTLDPERLAERLTLGGLEVEPVRLADGDADDASVTDGRVLDFEITPNRGDCFSVLGIAREVAALAGERLQTRAVPPVPPLAAAMAESPSAVESESTARTTLPVTLVAPSACPRFVGRVIRRIAPGRRSPEWLRLRLERAGLRALHPVVDVTNYVMLEFGQPLHGYDLHALRGGIRVRFAAEGEALTLLNGDRVALQPDVLVIADDSGAIGLAGIMGGAGAAVSDATRDVFLESAFFSPRAIGGRARRFGLHTDASLRFERGVDPAQQRRAIERATALLTGIAGGEPGPVVEAVVESELPVRKPIPLRLERLNAVLGTSLGAAQVEAQLRLLGMAATSATISAKIPAKPPAEASAKPSATTPAMAPAKAGWFVVPPEFRFDLEIEEDLIEEVGRMAGYDNIPVAAEASPRHVGQASEAALPEARVADALCARGYSEVVTYGFVDEELAEAVNPGAEHVRLANPLSREMGVMRRSLWPGLLDAARHNRSRQRTRLRLFEIGAQFGADGDAVRERRVLAGLALGAHHPEHWEGAGRDVDFFDVKSDVEAVLSLAGRSAEAVFQPVGHPALARGQSARLLLVDRAAGWLGVLHPRLQARMGWKRPAILFALSLDRVAQTGIPRYRDYSKFPSLRRDIAVVVDEDVSAASLLACVRRAAGDALGSATIFDIYRGKGIDSRRKSVALGLILQDRSRTLTDTDADRIVASATRRLERELKATIRE